MKKFFPTSVPNLPGCKLRPFHCCFLSPLSLSGSSVTQLLARDLDNDPLVFGVVGEEASRFFAVESVTGVVWLRQPLDREVTTLTANNIQNYMGRDELSLFIWAFQPDLNACCFPINAAAALR